VEVAVAATYSSPCSKSSSRLRAPNALSAATSLPPSPLLNPSLARVCSVCTAQSTDASRRLMMLGKGPKGGLSPSRLETRMLLSKDPSSLAPGIARELSCLMTPTTSLAALRKGSPG
jgi:hypothetical protein